MERRRDRKQRQRAEERLPRKLIPQLLLGLYELFPDHEPQRGKVLYGTLAAGRLVCRRWSKIVKSIRGGFIIKAYDKEWLSPSFPYYLLQRTSPLLDDQGESHPRWFSESYTTALVNSHPKFLPELVRNLFSGLYLRDGFDWYKQNTVVQSTLAACCLVSREWNRTFTPILYKDIVLGGNKSLLARSLLRRTFQHTRPTNAILVKTMTIEPADDGSTTNLLSTCFSFSFPKLQTIMLNFRNTDPAAIHPNFAQILRSLSRRCTIQMGNTYNDLAFTKWKSLFLWINFIQRSGLIPCSFYAEPSHSGYWISFVFKSLPIYNQGTIFSSNTYFYIGKHETFVSGDVGSSDIKTFNQHLTQTGQNLMVLYLNPHEPSSLPEIDLRKNTNLRVLQLNFHFEDEKTRESQDDLLRWFDSICESMVSNSLVIEVSGLCDEPEICNKMQETLLRLHARTVNLSVYLTHLNEWGYDFMKIDDMRRLFSRLYDAGIVIEKRLDDMELRTLAFSR